MKPARRFYLGSVYIPWQVSWIVSDPSDSSQSIDVFSDLLER